MKIGIGARLMLGATVGVLAVVAVVSFAGFRIGRKGLEEQISSHLESLAQSRAAHVQTFLRAHRQMIEMAASSHVFRIWLRRLEASGADQAAVVAEMNVRLQHFLDPGGGIYEVFCP